MTDAPELAYYLLDRRELYDFARSTGVRVHGPALNVGCAAGRDAPALRSLGASEIHGIEPAAAAADLAAQQYDRVFHGTVESWDPEGRRYGLVVFADVLEHLPDPRSVLLSAHGWLARDGLLLISIPNIRHVSVLWRLAVRGTWRYEDHGIMDRTHLRFFTSASFRELLDETGYRLLALRRHGAMPATRAVERLIPGTGEFLLSQVLLLATPA